FCARTSSVRSLPSTTTRWRPSGRDSTSTARAFPATVTVYRWVIAPGRSAFDEALEALAARGMPQLAQGLGLDLADALARDLEVLAHLLEGVVGLLADAEAHAQDLL